MHTPTDLPLPRKKANTKSRSRTYTHLLTCRCRAGRARGLNTHTHTHTHMHAHARTCRLAAATRAEQEGWTVGTARETWLEHLMKYLKSQRTTKFTTYTDWRSDFWDILLVCTFRESWLEQWCNAISQKSALQRLNIGKLVISWVLGNSTCPTASFCDSSPRRFAATCCRDSCVCTCVCVCVCMSTRATLLIHMWNMTHVRLFKHTCVCVGLWTHMWVCVWDSSRTCAGFCVCMCGTCLCVCVTLLCVCATLFAWSFSLSLTWSLALALIVLAV